MIEATVYVPSFLGGPPLQRCLMSLRRQTVPISVVVADNSSGPDLGEMLSREFPEVVRLGSGTNLGFGRALNMAISTFGEGPIVLLNDDTEARQDFVASLLSLSDEAPMVAGVLLKDDNPELIDSAGIIVDQTLMAYDYLSGSRVSSLEGAADPMGPTGGGALFDRKLFERVNGFDERIFLYYEDVDLALRLRSIGARCRLAPEAQATHGFSQTLGAHTPRKYAFSGWSRGYLLRRYGILRSPLLATGVFGRESIICCGQAFHDRTTAGASARWRGWREASGLDRLPVPPGSTTSISLWEALRLRRQGRNR